MSTQTRTTRKSAFTLVEMLIAVFILGIGLSAVVSVFYAAANLQQRAFDEIVTDQVRSNARAMIMARGFDETTVINNLGGVGGSWNSDGQVYRLADETADDMLEEGTNPQLRWPLPLRAFPLVDPDYPLGYPNPASPPPDADLQAVDRDFYWIPLVRDTDRGTAAGEQDWQVYAFVVRKWRDDMRPAVDFASRGDVANPEDDNGTDQYVPRVYGLTAQPGSTDFKLTDIDYRDSDNRPYIRVGDQVLIGTGVAATVIGIEGDTITLDIPHDLSSGSTKVWFAAPPFPDATSPTYSILTFGDAAVK